ncbi:MAG: TonB-dependent receptor [Bacteroidales bacterium]|nr:TonB-dependent receptor [Bacteroidales bacterium]
MKKNKPFGDLFCHSLKKTLLIIRNAVILLFLGIIQAYAVDAVSHKTKLFINTADAKSQTVIDQNVIPEPDNLLSEPQEKRITGTVNDKDGNPLPGVNVVVTGTTKGTITDVSGKYSLDVPQSAKSLTFSFLGYSPQTINIGASNQINLTMVESEFGLDEVVVIGYGTVKKTDLTGSVASIKPAELAAFPTTNVVQALSGRAAGVQIKQNTGAPGASISVRIRGTNSIKGSNEPLYVVDGFPASGTSLNFINNSDIESLEILKDASSTAIYGSRGANGVVLITTKSGKAGQTKVDIESSVGTQSLRNKLELCNATEYAEIYNEMLINDGKSPYFSQSDIASLGSGFDWQDFVFRKAMIQNHDVTVSGGNEKTQFSISGSMFDQEGIIKNSYHKRYSFRINLNHNISKKFTVNYTSLLTKIQERYQNSGVGTRGNSLISATLGAYPTCTPYNEDGSYTVLGAKYPWGTELKNPINWLNEIKSMGRDNRVLSNASITYKPFPKLAVRILGGIENSDYRSDYYQTLKFISSSGYASVGTSQSTSLLNENTVSYNNTIGKHSVSAVAGFTFQNFLYTSLGGSGTGFLSDNTETYSLGSASSAGIPSSGYSKSVLLSFIGRINYNYNDKYLATITFRSDGSSKYSEGKKWGYFPSAALAWKIKNEDFLKDVAFLSDLKLRGSWGVTGSQAISAYATLNQLYSGKTIFGDALNTTFAPGTQLPGDLKWESTKQTDVGFDAGFLNNRIRLTADYYIKNTTDLLNSVTLPSSLGYTSTIKNIGSIRNRGIEFEIGANIFSGDNLTWNVAGNIAFNKTEVIKLYGGKDIYGGSYNLSILDDYFNLLREGEQFAVFYGYTEAGYNDKGIIQYVDQNNDGLINSLDKTIIGNPNPDFIYGLNSTLTYKNFEFTVFLQGTQGNQICNLSSPSITLDYGFGLNSLKAAYDDHWTADNTTAKYPKITSQQNVKVSDRFVEDGSFLRLRNIQLAYNLPCQKLNINFLRSAQIYASGQNLLTFTKYSWWDPEVNSAGGSSSITQGIDFNTYPTAKSVILGIRIGF